MKKFIILGLISLLFVSALTPLAGAQTKTTKPIDFPSDCQRYLTLSCNTYMLSGNDYVSSFGKVTWDYNGQNLSKIEAVAVKSSVWTYTGVWVADGWVKVTTKGSATSSAAISKTKGAYLNRKGQGAMTAYHGPYQKTIYTEYVDGDI